MFVAEQNLSNPAWYPVQFSIILQHNTFLVAMPTAVHWKSQYFNLQGASEYLCVYDDSNKDFRTLWLWLLSKPTTFTASCANILEKKNVDFVKNPRQAHYYLCVPLANALKAFTFFGSAGVQWNLLGFLQSTTEILLVSGRMGGENAIINPVNKLGWFEHSTAALQLLRNHRFFGIAIWNSCQYSVAGICSIILAKSSRRNPLASQNP